jgi:hypothetical protein
VSRISIAIAIFVSGAVLEVGGALVMGRVMHVLAQDTEDHDAPDIIKEERELEKKFLRTLVVVDTLVPDENRTTVATAGAAMALVATAAMGMRSTLSSFHSLVMLSKRPLELIQ